MAGMGLFETLKRRRHSQAPLGTEEARTAGFSLNREQMHNATPFITVGMGVCVLWWVAAQTLGGLIGTALALLFGSVALIAWAMLPDVAQREMRQRVLSEVAYQEDRPNIWAQLAVILAPINRYVPTSWYFVHTSRKLEAAGKRMPAMHFLVQQEIGALTGLIFYLVFFGMREHVNPGWLAFFTVAGFFVPYFWLSNRIQNRRLSVSRDLPELVDLLSLCVDAGLDFMDSLNRVTREYRQCPTTEELGLVIQEVRVGKRRRDALRAFSTRLQVPEASSFSRTLIQADRMGTGITEALRILSEDMRVQRYHWAERFAQQAPLKMLLPLLFSLASALVIVAGPIMIQFLNGGFNFNSYTEQRPR
ncbi:MAG: hypothetical protein COV75_03080 [Candidatus Omnitrophica bacterium CG11_big_fil_rev_8_21_14_0_20_63_9]|nr:MAG: hypothetical protein COV75_03080 [Candidatus Omnitrophica bacterium CG11_big_fil_rev_8_21_14_0_20_63_9]